MARTLTLILAIFAVATPATAEAPGVAPAAGPTVEQPGVARTQYQEWIPPEMRDIGIRARASARVLGLAESAAKTNALEAAAKAIRASKAKILEANAKDLEAAKSQNMTAAFLDRLTLNEKSIDAIAAGVEQVALLPDPVGEVIADWQQPNGLMFQRVRTPFGVVAVIYESRPNVTADAGSLCLKAGNAVILRGGSDSFRSCRAIHECLVQGLREAGLPEAAITLVPTRDRAAVGLMLSGLGGGIDVIVPRGGKSLVARVEQEARVPVFAHLEGIWDAFSASDAESVVIVGHNPGIGELVSKLVHQAHDGSRLARDDEACAWRNI